MGNLVPVGPTGCLMCTGVVSGVSERPLVPRHMSGLGWPVHSSMLHVEMTRAYFYEGISDL